MTQWTPPSKAQKAAAGRMVEAIVTALRNDKGTHAETAIAGAARMAGTFLFRSLRLAIADTPPGTPVLSEAANEHGPLLVQTFGVGLVGEGIDPTKIKPDLHIPGQNQPLLSVTQTQEKLEPVLRAIAARHRLDDAHAAHACALAAAKLVRMTVEVLEPRTGFAVAAYGFIEGAKTMPIALAPAAAKKPWYRFWE
jgi:hypothetical protein